MAKGQRKTASQQHYNASPPLDSSCPLQTLPIELLIFILKEAYLDKTALPVSIVNNSSNNKRSIALKWLSSLCSLSSYIAAACQSLIFKKPIIQTIQQLESIHGTLVRKSQLTHYIQQILFVPKPEEFQVQARKPFKPGFSRSNEASQQMLQHYFRKLDEHIASQSSEDRWREGMCKLVRLCGGSLRSVKMISMSPKVFHHADLLDIFTAENTPLLETFEIGSASLDDPIVLDSAFTMLEKAGAKTQNIVFWLATSFNAPRNLNIRRSRWLTAPVTGHNSFMASGLRKLTLCQSWLFPLDLLHILSISPHLCDFTLEDTALVMMTDDPIEFSSYTLPFEQYGDQLKRLKVKVSHGHYFIFAQQPDGCLRKVYQDSMVDRVIWQMIKSCTALETLDVDFYDYAYKYPLATLRALAPTCTYARLVVMDCYKWSHRGQEDAPFSLSFLDGPNEESNKTATGLKKLTVGYLRSFHDYTAPLIVLGEIFKERGQEVEFLIECKMRNIHVLTFNELLGGKGSLKRR